MLVAAEFLFWKDIGLLVGGWAVRLLLVSEVSRLFIRSARL